MNLGFGLALLSAVMSLVLLKTIVSSLRGGTFQRWIVPYSLACLACLGMAIAAFVVGVGPLGFVLALLGLAFPGLFTSTHVVAWQPRNISVKVGDPVRDFTAVDGQGELFALSSMTGKRYLLKFYRGHW